MEISLFIKERLQTWLVYFMTLTDTLTNDEFASVMERLSLAQSKKDHLLQERTEVRRCLGLFAGGAVLRPSEIAESLRRFSMETLLS